MPSSLDAIAPEGGGAGTLARRVIVGNSCLVTSIAPPVPPVRDPTSGSEPCGRRAGRAIDVAGYRLRATFSRRWGEYAVLVLLIGLVGGIAMASVMAGRRTQSSYPDFLATTDASDITLSTYGIGNASATNYSPKVAAAIARVPGVKRVESWVGVGAIPLKTDGAPELALGNDVNFAGSKTGLYFDMDRVTPVQGRMANAGQVDEFMTTALGAKLMGVHMGQLVPIGLYTPQQFNKPGFGTPRVPPARRLDMKLVGIVEFNNQVIEDDTDQLPTNVVYTPAFTRLVPDDATNGTWYGIQLVHADRGIASIEQALLRVLPRGAAGNFSVTAITEAKVERAVKPESIALGLFGLIALMAGLGTALPVLARHLRSTEDDRQIMRALGAAPATTTLDALSGMVIAIVAGSLLACAVAVALSPLSPLGPVRRVYHPSVLVFDWTVLGGGLALLIGGLGSAAAILAVRTTPHRLARPAHLDRSPHSGVVQAASALGLPLPGVIGLHLALEPGRGRTAVPARWVLAGAVVAVATITATLTFSSSLNTLISHPRLYGWNWDYALMSENGIPPQALASLDHDAEVAGWSGYGDPGLQIDGQVVPALVTQGIPTVAPPVLAGHGLNGSGQVVLGAATLALLHRHIGDKVFISYGTPNTAPLYLPPTPALVVGTATFPAIAGSSTFADHPTMGTGALLTDADLPASFLRATKSPDPTVNGPALVFVRLRAHVSSSAGLDNMEGVVAVADKAFASDPNAAGDSAGVLPVQRPAEIVNYQSTGGTPVVLASGLATGAVVALALALTGTVRARRHDLALLKTLGFTRRQLAVTLAWQASATAVIGIVIGVPLGMATGRELWILFARNIDVVPQPSVPLSVLFVALAALVLANVVAAIPGRAAADTPAAIVLRQE